jgi:tetratricopeptide (TPR) repeat protein
MTPQEALALVKAGRAQEALQGCRQMLAAAPRQPEILGLAGAIAMALGNAAEAATFYETALAVRPESAELHFAYGHALTKLGRAEAAVDAYRAALKLRPDVAPIHNDLGVALQTLGRWDEAAAAYANAARLMPASAELQRNLGIALDGAGRRADAVAAYRRAVTLRPDWPPGYQSLATALLEHGEARACAEACDAWLRVQPGAMEPLGLKSVALEELGDRDGARYLVDLDRFLRVIPFDAAPGYPDLRAFNATLSRDVLNHPTRVTPSEGDAHYNGKAFSTTEELFGAKTGPWAALERMFTQEVTKYLAEIRRQDTTHPYVAHPPARWRPSAVGTVLDQLGSLAPHVHYDGYVSGVYYCQLPESIGAPGQGQAGWLEIGRLQARFQRNGKPEIRAVQPREGLMVLFPSYVFHNTVPFEAGQTRISIAFDAIPV